MRGTARRGGPFLALAGLVWSGCAGAPRDEPDETAPLALAVASQAATDDGRVTSNLRRKDYVGAATCGGCHREIHDAWDSSPMRRMTRPGSVADVKTPFDGRTFTFKGDTVTLLEVDGERHMAIEARRTGSVRYRVTRVIGGRYREDFAGVLVDGPGDGPFDDREWILPISFMIDREELRFKGYSVLVRERPGVHVSGVWNRTCVYCHNTAPGLSRLLGELAPGAPGYQAPRLDRILPEELRWDIEVTDPAALHDAVAAELAAVAGPARARAAQRASTEHLLLATILATREELSAGHLIDEGVGCEACHGGSREHAVAPSRVKPTFEPRAEFLRLRPADGRAPTEADWINRSCAQCHQVLFSRYPYTWEGGLRRDGPGGSPVNSGEARDFLLGGCANEMSCTTCHDPHHRDDPKAMARLRTTAGNLVCTSCHEELVAPAALAAHSHHAPDGDGSACVACHMPEKNVGLNTDLTTYHRIGSPTDPARVAGDRPLECALCHTDASPGALADAMERLWGGRYDRTALAASYGDLDANTLLATARRGKPHEQLVAVHTLVAALTGPRAPAWPGARAPDRRAVIDALVPHLVHDLPLVRYHTRAALEAIVGEQLPVDLHQDADAIAAEAAAWQRDLADP